MSTAKPDADAPDRVAPRFARTRLAQLGARGREETGEAARIVPVPLSSYFEGQGKRRPRTYDDEVAEARNIDWDLVMPGVFSRDTPREEDEDADDCGSAFSPG